MSDTKQFIGKNVLVTGASGGIGQAIARAFSTEGANLALQYHTNRPEALEGELREGSGKYITVKADLTEDGFEAGLFKEIAAELGAVDILINCAASQDVSGFENMSASDFSRMMQMNVGGVFALSKLFASQLLARNSNAAIVNISSIEGSRPARGHGHYASSKAALEMLTKAMALEYGSSGLRVNAVAPGLISRAGIEEQWPDGVSRWKAQCPLECLGTPQDVADAVLFLASPQARWISGSVLTVDGGMSAGPGW